MQYLSGAASWRTNIADCKADIKNMIRDFEEKPNSISKRQITINALLAKMVKETSISESRQEKMAIMSKYSKLIEKI